MKRETLEHPKTYGLMGYLQCEQPTALGYLTLLWDFTGQVAVLGDIGKWPNGTIAQACRFRGDADEFIAALIRTHWIDEVDDPAIRLLIHDWPDHCEKWVKNKASRAQLDIELYYKGPKVPRRCTDTVRPPSDQCTDDLHPSYPILSNPILSQGQSNPNPVSSAAQTLVSQGDTGGSSSDSEIRQWCQWWNDLHEKRLVTSGVNVAKPSQAIVAGWKRVQKSAELREMLADRDAITRIIEWTPFLCEGWFRLERLLGGKNKDGEYILRKLLDGGYKSGTRTKAPAVGPGQRHPADRRDKNGVF